MNHQAIYNTHPNVATIDDSTGAMDANGDYIVLDQAKVDVEAARLQSEYNAQEYARNRVKAYASIGDQLDMQYWDSVNNTTTWKDHIASVKDQFPKV